MPRPSLPRAAPSTTFAPMSETTPNDKLVRIEITAPPADADLLRADLFDAFPSGWEEDENPQRVVFRIHAEDVQGLDDIVAGLEDGHPEAGFETVLVPRRDWTLAWREFFTAVVCGSRFVVIAPWMREERPFQDRTPIVIEPKTAFGTGHHATTALCLEVVSDLADQGFLKPGMDFLDLGTGSGVLGVGCCLLGMRGLGLDIDPLAIDNARENKQFNGVDEAFEVQEGSIDDARGQAYDLVLANILAEPLQLLAPQITAAVRPGGALVLSGLLVQQAQAVQEAYARQGLAAPRLLERDNWAALVYTRPAARP